MSRNTIIGLSIFIALAIGAVIFMQVKPGGDGKPADKPAQPADSPADTASPEDSDDANSAINEKCLEVWRKYLRMSDDNDGLSQDEYNEMVKECPALAGAWLKDLQGDGSWKPKTRDPELLEALENWRKKGVEEARKRDEELTKLREAEAARWTASHGGGDHTPCECWDLVAYAKYDHRDNIAITSRDPAAPTKIPAEGLTFISGRDEELGGPFVLNETNCCEPEHISHFVQIAHSLPDGSGTVPDYKGPSFGDDRPDATREFGFWTTLSSTPGDYGWTMGTMIPPYLVDVHAKREHEVREVFGNLTPLRLGPGKIEMRIEDLLCPDVTLWYEIVPE